MSRYETFDRSQLELRSLEERGCDLWEPQIAELASPDHPLDSDSEVGWALPTNLCLRFMPVAGIRKTRSDKRI